MKTQAMLGSPPEPQREPCCQTQRRPPTVPATPDLAGRHAEAVLQGRHAVLQNHAGALKTRLGEKMHLRHTDEFSILESPPSPNEDRTESASDTYLELGRGLKITLEGKKSAIKLTPTPESLV